MSAVYVEGTYQRSVGMKRVYTYTGSFHFNGVTLIWGATVRYLGEAKGTPSGQISNATPANDFVDRVKRAIENSIENLDDIAE